MTKEALEERTPLQTQAPMTLLIAEGSSAPLKSSESPRVMYVRSRSLLVRSQRCAGQQFRAGTTKPPAMQGVSIALGRVN